MSKSGFFTALTLCASLSYLAAQEPVPSWTLARRATDQVVTVRKDMTIETLAGLLGPYDRKQAGDGDAASYTWKVDGKDAVHASFRNGVITFIRLTSDAYSCDGLYPGLVYSDVIAALGPPSSETGAGMYIRMTYRDKKMRLDYLPADRRVKNLFMDFFEYQ